MQFVGSIVTSAIMILEMSGQAGGFYGVVPTAPTTTKNFASGKMFVFFLLSVHQFLPLCELWGITKRTGHESFLELKRLFMIPLEKDDDGYKCNP